MLFMNIKQDYKSGWEGNRRSGVALAMRHRLSGISTYRLNGLGKGDELSSFGVLRHLYRSVANGKEPTDVELSRL